MFIIKISVFFLIDFLSHHEDMSNLNAISHHQARSYIYVTKLLVLNKIMLKNENIYDESSIFCILEKSLLLVDSRSVNPLLIFPPSILVVYPSRIFKFCLIAKAHTQDNNSLQFSVCLIVCHSHFITYRSIFCNCFNQFFCINN